MSLAQRQKCGKRLVAHLCLTSRINVPNSTPSSGWPLRVSKVPCMSIITQPTSPSGARIMICVFVAVAGDSWPDIATTRKRRGRRTLSPPPDFCCSHPLLPIIDRNSWNFLRVEICYTAYIPPN